MGNEKKEVKFVNGVFIKSPFDGLIKLSIAEEKFLEFFYENAKDVEKKDGTREKYLNIDIKKSKDKTDEKGNPIYFAALDTWEKS